MTKKRLEIPNVPMSTSVPLRMYFDFKALAKIKGITLSALLREGLMYFRKECVEFKAVPVWTEQRSDQMMVDIKRGKYPKSVKTAMVD